MATTVARLQAVLSANTRDFDRAMDKSHGRLGRVGKAAGVAGVALGGALAYGLASSVKEAIQAEKANRRLEQAYKQGIKGGIDPFRQSIEKAGRAAVNLGFDDEDLKDSLGSLIIATHNHRKAQDAANVAMDLARFKGVDLQQATKMLTMAMAGSQRAIKQLGLAVPSVTTEYDRLKAKFGEHISASEKVALAQAKINDKQATAAKVIDTVSGKMKGQADVFAQTAEGQMAVFQEKTDNLKEHLGTILLPALGKVVDKLIKMADWLERNPKVMKGLIVALGVLTAALLTAAAAQLALNLAVLANPYVAATLAVIAFYGAVFVLWKKFEQLRPALEFFVETIAGVPLPLRLALAAMGGMQGAVDKLRGPVMKLADAFHTVYNWVSKVKDLFQWIIDHAKSIGGVFGSITGALSKVPHGDPMDPNMFKTGLGGFGTGPKSISPALYDELSGARSMGLTLSSGYRPGAITKHGTPSDHGKYPSKAIDVAGAPANMARFFRWLIGQTDVKQAFYDPLGSIFGGMLSSYREGGHSDHVHVATYDKGGWLRPGWNLAYNGLGQPERVGGGGNLVVNLPNYVGDKQEIVSILQNWARQHRRRNGRSAF